MSKKAMNINTLCLFTLMVALKVNPVYAAPFTGMTEPPPLNQYGAVDADAVVPMATQIDPVPEGFEQKQVLVESTEWPNLVPKEPSLSSKSYILMSSNTGQVLAANDPHKRLAPASMTKLMSIYITEKELRLGNIHLDDMITVPKVAWATRGSSIFLKPGDKVTVESLVKGSIVASGNDATVALAVHIAGTQEAFVSMMNHEAQKLDMRNTHFNNVTGLPSPSHYSSAYDLATLARAVVNEYPEYLSWFSERSFTHDGIKQSTYNKLLNQYKYAIGLKTGATAESGYSLISAAKRPDNDTILLGVVMGTKTPDLAASNSQALLNYGFRFFETQQLYAADEAINHPKVYMGNKTHIAVGLRDALTLTYPKMESRQLSAEIIIDDHLKAPIDKGQQIGTLQIKLQDKMLLEEPIVALEDDQEGSVWRRFRDRIALMFS